MDRSGPRNVDVETAVQSIVAERHEVPAQRSVLIGITGIDGSGKGHVAEKIVSGLTKRGLRAVVISVDGWLNLPHVRFSAENPAEHFYEHALRLDEMFDRLVLPLREQRSLRLEADFAEETATAYRKHTYDFDEVDVIVLEGIFLLKTRYRGYFNLCYWVDCTFETALERAIARGQEGLPREETVRAYHTIYFPAQRIHVARDDPRGTATAIIVNDTRIGASNG